MATENETKSSYEAVLADLRAQRERIDNTIRVLETMSALGLVNNQGSQDFRNTPSNPSQNANDALSEGEFLGMSIVDATKRLLAIRKRQMGNKEIAKELAAGGLVMNSADPINIVGSVMTRRFNQVGDVVRVGRGTWGLKEWYPNRTFKVPNKIQTLTGDDVEIDAARTELDELIDGVVASENVVA